MVARVSNDNCSTLILLVIYRTHLATHEPTATIQVLNHHAKGRLVHMVVNKLLLTLLPLRIYLYHLYSIL